MPTTPEDTRTEHYRQLSAYKDDAAYQGLGDDYEGLVKFFGTTVGRRWEIDAAIYDEALNVLPPLGWRGDSFYFREFLFDDITHKFTREGDRYFCEVAHFPPRPQPKLAEERAADPAPGS